MSVLMRGLRDRLLEALAGPAIDARVTALVEQRLAEVSAEDRRKEDLGWRRITQTSQRELAEMTYERQSEIAYWLWLRNPMAKRLVQLQRDMILGDGALLTAGEEKVQEVLDAHWKDPVNNWPLTQFDRVLELALYGEQIWPSFVNQTNGHVRLGYIDPVRVKEMVRDPENDAIITAVRLKGTATAPERDLAVIRPDEGPLSPTHGRLTGQTFLFQVNRVTTVTRGVSDLFGLADWLDGLDQFLFKLLERAGLLNAFVWDIVLKGPNVDAARIRERHDELRANPPRPGGYLVHGEQEEWSAKCPDLKSEDFEKIARLIRLFILGGAGIPEHWFGEGEGTTYASAKEMAAPSVRSLRARQGYVRAMLTQVADYVIDQAIIARRLPDTIDRTFQVVLPELSSRDAELASKVLTAVVQVLIIAVENRWLSHETAQRVAIMMLAELGPDIDLEEERKLIEDAVGEDYEGTAKALRRLQAKLSGSEDAEHDPALSGLAGA